MNERPHDDALLALLYDELPPGEADALREKLAAESPESLDRLMQWQAIRNVVAELPELEPDPQIHYDIIREARRAVDTAEKPSRLWAWLEQLTLMPALAGLLLVVLAAGLTLRLTTDLEQADDSALAPGAAAPETSAPAGPKGEGQATEGKKAAAARDRKSAAPERAIDQEEAAVAAAAEPVAEAPDAPRVEAEPAPVGDTRAGQIDGVDPTAAFGDAPAPSGEAVFDGKGTARGEAKGGAGPSEKAKRATAPSGSKKGKAKPRKSRREAPPERRVTAAKDKSAISTLFDEGDAPAEAAPLEPAPAEPTPVDTPTASAPPPAPPRVPADDLLAELGGAEVEAKAVEQDSRRAAD